MSLKTRLDKLEGKDAQGVQAVIAYRRQGEAESVAIERAIPTGHATSNATVRYVAVMPERKL